MLRRMLIATGLLLLGACRREDPDLVVGAQGEGSPAPVTLLLQATSYDWADYAVWIEWQDESGGWSQTYLFPLFGEPSTGPVTNYQILLANPEVPYYVLLADPAGTLFDQYLLWLPGGCSVDVRFNVVAGRLSRIS